MPDSVTPEIIQEAANGNRRAFRTIVEQHQGFVYSVAFRFVRDPEGYLFIRKSEIIIRYNNCSISIPHKDA